VGTAVASSNSVQVTPPSSVPAKTLYSISLSGHAARKERLYLFVDYHKCGANPQVEHSRASGDYWYVNGDFTEVAKGWYARKTGKDHVCAFLQKKSQAVNAAGGVTAHAFKAYQII
jgi:hypothetical protein